MTPFAAIKFTGGRNRQSDLHVGDGVRLRATSPVHPGKLGVVTREPRFGRVDRVFVRIEGFVTDRQIPIVHLVRLPRMTSQGVA